MIDAVNKLGVLKFGVGYDLVVNRETGRLVLGSRCHTCGRTSYHPKDVEERYCSACHTFHEDQQGPTQIA
jgi:uncharacterized OB-fold protein